MFTVIDLFSGAGGMTLGFTAAGFRPTLAVDFDRAAIETYAANFGPDHAVHAPIERIDSFPSADVIVGGPPCQGFSNLGKRDPTDPRNELWRHYLRAVEQVAPQVLVMENVPQLLGSPQFGELLERLHKLGYSVISGVLNAADYGVPQRRRRAILIGALTGRPSFPAPTHGEPASAAVRSGLLNRWSTVRDAIGDLPLEPTEADWHIGRSPKSSSLDRYRTIPEGGNRWDLYRARPDLTPDCWIRKTRGGTDLFGRLWWDRPAFTIRTEFYKPEKGRYLHPEAHRPLTHREAARLQSFSDSFKWRGTKIEVARQIGNAVPPLLAEVVANEALRLLAEPRAVTPKPEPLPLPWTNAAAQLVTSAPVP